MVHFRTRRIFLLSKRPGTMVTFPQRGVFMTLLKSVAVSLFVSGVILAQTSTSQITGTVRDSTGAVVPGAQVTATNEETGVAYRQQTTPAGLFAFPALAVGRYTIA